MVESKLAEACAACPQKDSCDKKRLEAGCFLSPASAGSAAMDVAAPVLRDRSTVTIRLDSETTVQVSREDILRSLRKSFSCNFLREC